MTIPSAPPGPSIPTGWGLVAAPVDLLPVIYRLIEERLGLTAQAPTDRPPRDRPPSPREEPSQAETSAGNWPEARLREFAETGKRLTAIGLVVGVMDICAQQPDEWIPTDVLAEKLAENDPAMTMLQKRDQLRRAWTHLTRHLKAQYHHKDWPLEAMWGPQIGQPLNQVHYMTTTDQAERWKQARVEEGLEQ